MKLLHVSESISTLSGGLQATVYGFAKSLSKWHSNIILSAKDSGEIEINDMEVVLTGTTGLWKVKFLTEFTSIVDAIKPDLIVQHGIWSPFALQVTNYCARRDVPYVVVPHGMLDPYILSQNKIQKKLALILYQKKNLKQAKFIRVLNENEKDHTSRIVRNKIVVSPNGLSAPNYKSNVCRVRNKVVFLGRIDQKKSVYELVEAWRSLEDDGNLPEDAILEIGGWSNSNSYKDKVMDKIKDSKTIKFVGPLFGMKKWDFLYSSEAFVLPSKGEGLPTVVLEAWSAGVLALISDNCNFSKSQMERCVIKTGTDAQSVRDSLTKFFEMSEYERQLLVRESYIELENYSWENIANEFLEHVH